MSYKEKFNDIMQNKNVAMSVLTLFFILGVISYFSGTEISFAVLVTAAACTLTLTKLIDKKTAAVLIFVFYAGFFNSFLRIRDFDEVSLLAPKDVEITGQIINIPEVNSKNCKFEMAVSKADSEEISGKILVWMNDPQKRFSEYKIGDICTINGSLRLPPKATNPSQFDYARFLQNHKISSVLYTTPEKTTEIGVNNSLKWKFLRNLNDLRHKILTVHEEFLKTPNLQILGGIVFGDDAVSPPEYVKDSFINSGLLHILAASGMNVAFIWGFWFFIMRKFRAGYRKTLISGIFVVLLYMCMTGLGASVVRAGLMLIFVLIGKLIDRDAHSVSLLSFVALLMLIYNPAYLNDVGFQMSFLATLGILTTGHALNERLKDVKLPNIIKGDVAIPVIAQGWVAPIQMLYFNTFAPYAIFANIAIIPFLCIVSFGGFISSILAMFYPYTKYPCLAVDFVVNILISIILKISDFFSALDYSLLITAKPHIIQLLIYYGIVALITIMLKYGFNKRILIAVITMILILLVGNIKIPSKNLEITAFDVQNADCFLLKTPKNDYYIIDSGKFPYTSKNSQASITIGKYLKDNGIRKIKGLIITHFDNDHAGGAAYIIQNFKIKNVYLYSKDTKSITAVSIFSALELANKDYKIAQNNEVIENYPDFKMTLLRSGDDKNENENSIQTLVSYRDFDMLFTGDAGVSGYEKIQNSIPANTEILKVGHHGAKNVTNTKMLEQMKPQAAIISTGINYFGHPSAQTIENLNRNDIKIYRTDYDGAIKIKTDGRKFSIQTYDTKKRRFSKIKDEYEAK